MLGGNPASFLDPDGEFGLATLVRAAIGRRVGAVIGAAVEVAVIGAISGTLINGTLCIAGSESFLAGAGGCAMAIL